MQTTYKEKFHIVPHLNQWGPIFLSASVYIQALDNGGAYEDMIK